MYCYLKCIVYDKLLKPRQSFWITLYKYGLLHKMWITPYKYGLLHKMWITPYKYGLLHKM